MQFFKEINKLKNVIRWMGKRTIESENVKSHSFDVAVIAAMLATAENAKYGGDYNIGEVVLYALFHDVSEAVTGDLPTPIKYFNTEIRDAYRGVEAAAKRQLVDMLAGGMEKLGSYVIGDESNDIKAIVKAADYLSMIEFSKTEYRFGNVEFNEISESVAQLLRQSILSQYNLRSVHDWLAQSQS